MFKRLLVLVLFVTGVFWWLTNRNAGEIITNDPNSDTKVVITEPVEIDPDDVEPETMTGDANVLDEGEADPNQSELDTTLSSEVDTEVNNDILTEGSNEVTSAVRPTVVPTNYSVKASETIVPVPPVVVPVPTVVTPVVSSVAPVVAVEPVQEPMSTSTEPNMTAVEIEAESDLEPVETPSQAFADRSIEVRAYLYEWGLDFSSKRIQAGNVTFNVINSGQFPHDFNIRGVGALGTVPGKGRSQFTVYLEPGAYEVYSDRRNDYERGLIDTIRVIE